MSGPYKNKHSEDSARWQRKNKQKVNEASRARRDRLTREQKDALNAKQRSRYANNPKCRETLNRLAREYRQEPQFVIAQKLRMAVLGHACRMASIFSEFMQAVTGLSKEEFANRYSAQGQFDHVVPLVSFDLTNPEHLVRAMHPSNIRIVSAFENQSKGGSGRTDAVLAMPWVETEDALARAAAFISRVTSRIGSAAEKLAIERGEV